MANLMVCAGNALLLGGPASNHTLVRLSREEVKNIGEHGHYLDSDYKRPDLDFATCFKDGRDGHWYALKAGFKNAEQGMQEGTQAGTQEGALYNNLLKAYPLGDSFGENQVFWNKQLTAFVNDRFDKIKHNMKVEVVDSGGRSKKS